MNRYTKEHLCLHRLSPDHARIGVTAFALEALGDIVAIELPYSGEVLKRGRPFGTIESAKTVSDLYTPLDGVIITVNQPVLDSPAILNQDHAIWLVEMKIQHLEQWESLLTFEQYSLWMKGEET